MKDATQTTNPRLLAIGRPRPAEPRPRLLSVPKNWKPYQPPPLFVQALPLAGYVGPKGCSSCGYLQPSKAYPYTLQAGLPGHTYSAAIVGWVCKKCLKRLYLAMCPAPEQVAYARLVSAHPEPGPLHTCRQATLAERMAALLQLQLPTVYRIAGQTVGSLWPQPMPGTEQLGWAPADKHGLQLGPPVADFRGAMQTIRESLTYPKP